MRPFAIFRYAPLLLCALPPAAAMSSKLAGLTGEIPALCEFDLGAAGVERARSLYPAHGARPVLSFRSYFRSSAFARERLFGAGMVRSSDELKRLRAELRWDRDRPLVGVPRLLKIYLDQAPDRAGVEVDLARAGLWDRAGVHPKHAHQGYDEIRERYFETAQMDDYASIGAASAGREDGSRVYVVRHLCVDKGHKLLEVGLDVPRGDAEVYLPDRDFSRDSGRIVFTPHGTFCRVPIVEFRAP